MQALVKRTEGPGMSLDAVPVPEIGPTDVLIRIQKTGICGTDYHIYSWDTWARNRVRPPFTVGHEFMGVIEKIGGMVERLRVGDRVSGEGHIGCRHCYFCRTGQGHICRDVQIIGVDRDGCFAEFLSLPAGNVWNLKPEISSDVAAILDPIGNAMHTVTAQNIAGRAVAIIGAGAIGLIAVQIARSAGAMSVIAIEPQEHKRTLALQFGAAAAFDPTSGADWQRQFCALTPTGMGADVVLEMSGSGTGIRNAFELARPGADVALLGIPSKEVQLDLSEGVIFKGLVVRGINGRLMFETWYQSERFLVEKKIDVLPIITHRVHYREYMDAFALLERGEAVKILLEWEN